MSGTIHTPPSREPPYRLPLEVPKQPTDTSCGPTCLHALYNFHGDPVPISQLIAEIPKIEGGGTLAVMLGSHALRRGYQAVLYTYNLRIFDPIWFGLPRSEFADRLRQQCAVRTKPKERMAARAYLDFFELGGKIGFEDLTSSLIRRHLKRGQPILTGLSATFLYRSIREIPETNKDDDIRGDPVGHFVVLYGYDAEHREVYVADPYPQNPFLPGTSYSVSIDRLINAILLGVLTYDANLLVITPER